MGDVPGWIVEQGAGPDRSDREIPVCLAVWPIHKKFGEHPLATPRNFC